MSCRMTGEKELAVLAYYVAEVVNDQRNDRSGIGAFEGLGGLRETVRKAQAADGKRFDGWVEAGAVYALLYRMNMAAFCVRYGNNKEAMAGLPATIPLMPEILIPPTDEEHRAKWQVCLWNLIRFYLYQCAEGDIPRWALFEGMCDFAASIANEVVADAARAQGCGWGVWADPCKE